MAGREHRYRVGLAWSGAAVDAAAFRRHDRGYVLTAAGKPAIQGSSDAGFRGDGAKWNPEDLMVASLSACHQLWYMGLCAASGVVVVAYEDAAEGVMVEESAGGGGQFTAVTLRPRVTLAAGADAAKAAELHQRAHELCFIARSVNFQVTVEPEVRVTQA